jgi:hypothetical protein
MVHESILRDFFLGKVDAQVLSRDIEGSRVITSQPGTLPVVSRNHIVDMGSDFEVSRANLVAVCNAFLTGSLKAGDVEFIGYALACSDRFRWDGDQDNTLATIINDWAAPEINYPLNVENIQRCRRWLEGTEKYPDRAEAAS